ncbi:MAG: hypothetical protein JOZ54_00160 [Acidobacteria bacterium]|nr:hypothetical protein [Acidobacteriota bacterium]
MNGRRLSLVLALLLLPIAAFAQQSFPQLATNPPQPVAGQPVTVLVGWMCPVYALRGVNGHVIELTTISSVCVSAQIPGQQPFNVGPLAAGTYEVRVIDQDNFLIGTFAVVADPAVVPALDERGIWALAIVILALGVIAIGRAAS